MQTEALTPALTHPVLEQTLDRTRPHQLVSSSDPRRGGHLIYRYTDSGQLVSVPNMSYNQTAAVKAAVTRDAIAQIQEKIDASKRDTRLSPDAREDIARRYRARITELGSILEAQEIDARNEGMGIYSCGNPTADNVNLPRSRVAAERYLGTLKPAIDAAFDRIFSGDDFYGALKHWEDLAEQAREELCQAFYFDTSNINSRNNCNRMTAERIVHLALKAAHKQPEYLMPTA